MTIYIHMTPEEALEFATRLIARAKTVNEAVNRFKRYDAYEYFTVGNAAEEGKKDAGDKVRIRIGNERL